MEQILKYVIVFPPPDSNIGVYATSISPTAPARVGDSQLENGGLLDDKHFIIDGEAANIAVMLYTNGQPHLIGDLDLYTEYFDYLLDEGWIGDE